MSLKDETAIFAKHLRNKYLGTPKQASLGVINAYEKENGTLFQEDLVQNFSSILGEILRNQSRLFKIACQEIEETWLDHLDDDETFNHKIREYKLASLRLTEEIESENDIADKKKKIIHLLAPIQRSLAISNTQAGKSRAGSAFEYHIENLLERLNFEFDTQVTPQRLEEKFDFIFPSKEKFEEYPNVCMLCEAQTTLKDRFRLTQGKALTVQTNKYLFTTAGTNIMRDATSDFTDGKLSEIQSKGVTLVVFKEVKDQWNHNTMRSFEEFIQSEYPSQKTRWQ